MADAQQNVDITPLRESKDNKKDLDVIQNPFSTKTIINDTALVVEGKKLYVCKHVLCLVSPVFRAMFQLDMVEKRMDEIPLPGKRLSDMIEFLLCVYPDTRKSITVENADVLVPLFTEYQVDNLKAVCQQTLEMSCEKTTDVDTLVDHLLLAYTYNMGDLKRRCIQLASTRNTDTLREALGKHDLPHDVTSELWASVTKMRDSEIESLVSMCELLPIVKEGQSKIIAVDEHNSYDHDISFRTVTVNATVERNLRESIEAVKYIKAIQTAHDHKLCNTENILTEMFATDMYIPSTENAVRMTKKLPQTIIDALFKKIECIRSKHGDTIDYMFEPEY